jgi:hypothetical protein
LIVRNQNCLFGSVRRASLIFQGIQFGVFNLLLLCCAYGFYRLTGRFDGDWRGIWLLPLCTAYCLMLWCAGGLMTGYVWVPWP